MTGIYHVLNRGVDKRKIFLDEKDYLRFVHDLFEFNDSDPVSNAGHFFNKNKCIDLRSQYRKKTEERKKRKMLVDILAFCLMPNHYHLILSSKVEKGISQFMRKLDVGYAKYFNQRYEREGTLLQGRYKSILITAESHFTHLPYYVHLNPLDLIDAGWRKREIKNTKKAMKFLENYRWSSFRDYIGIKNFPSVTSRKFLLDFFGGPEQYKQETEKWLKQIDLEKIKTSLLE